MLKEKAIFERIFHEKSASHEVGYMVCVCVHIHTYIQTYVYIINDI